MTFMTYMMGGTCCDEISMQLDAVLADPSVNAVVFHVDSPGGGVYGIEELSDKIYNARAKKPCYSIADSEACSAAYWLATAAQTVCCTPGGMVGSVGVFSVHLDRSKELEQAGIKVTLIKAGKRKAEGFPSEPLDEDARASMQDSVNETYGKFIDALARNRHDVSKADVREKFGQGGVVSADAALAAKMIDRVCSFEDLMQRLTGYAGTGSPSNMAAVNMLKLRQDQRERETEFMLDDEE
jgi:signal peptide peptidase SppA